MKILLLYGFSKAGKDTVAELLVKEHGYHRFAFADRVKEVAAEQLQVPLEWFHDVEKKNTILPGKNKTLREYCIEIGEGGRAADPEFWGKQVVAAIQKKDCERVVLSDWRCYPEFFAIQKAFPSATILPIKIIRTDQYISPVPDMTEYNLSGFPFQFRIINDGKNLDKLREELKYLPL